MSDYDDEFEDESNDASAESNLVKDLRRQLKAEKKARAEEGAELSKFRSESRSKSVAKLIEDAGGNPAYAKFYNSEDASEESVKAWITAESELLGVKQPEPDIENADQVNQISQALNNAPQVKMGSQADSIARLQGAKTKAEFDEILNSVFRS